MDCESAQNLISARTDRELDDDQQMSLDAHLAGCAECRDAADALQTQDALLLRAFRGARNRASAVAERTISELHEESAVHNVVPSPRRQNWVSLLLAVAIGFLFAVVIFQPWNPKGQISSNGVVVRPKSQAPVSVAQVVVATGIVEVKDESASDWSVADLQVLQCPTGTSVRTGADARCEFETSVGCVVRLNSQTELKFRSPREVELHSGQLWCSSPQNVTLRIITEKQLAPPNESATKTGTAAWNDPTTSIPSFSCPSNSSMYTSIGADGNVQVTSANGEIEVQTKTERQNLRSGQTAIITGGQLAKSTIRSDPIMATRWIHALLIKKGHDNEELIKRVDDLLARMGRAKMSSLYETEIRGLGEYSVLPLLRFVQSPFSKTDHTQRISAMRIIADLAPSWAVMELIALLKDESPEIRVLAASALKRLTGETQGRATTEWRKDWAECEAAHRSWQLWQQQNLDRFPPLGVGRKTVETR